MCCKVVGTQNNNLMFVIDILMWYLPIIQKQKWAITLQNFCDVATSSNITCNTSFSSGMNDTWSLKNICNLSILPKNICWKWILETTNVCNVLLCSWCYVVKLIRGEISIFRIFLFISTLYFYYYSLLPGDICKIRSGRKLV